MSSADAPITLSVDVDDHGDRALVGVDRGELAIAIQAPADVDADELAELLEDVPDAVAKHVPRFTEGDR